MICELIDFYEELFPSISPYTAQSAKNALSQFYNNESNGEFLLSNNLDNLTQGDIFSAIPFMAIGEDGDVSVFKAKAMLITNTCDASRNSNVEFIPLHPIKEYSTDSEKIQTLKNNKLFQFLYLPDNRLENYFIDFGGISTYSRAAFLKLIEQEKVKKLGSLSEIGYFTFISKMTVFFMRPEDKDVYSSRSS